MRQPQLEDRRPEDEWNEDFGAAGRAVVDERAGRSAVPSVWVKSTFGETAACPRYRITFGLHVAIGTMALARDASPDSDLD